MDYGVIKMNIDTDTQYAFTRPAAGHMFTNYDGVLKVDGEVGNKKAYDPRAWGKLAEAGMSQARGRGLRGSPLDRHHAEQVMLSFALGVSGRRARLAGGCGDLSGSVDVERVQILTPLSCAGGAPRGSSVGRGSRSGAGLEAHWLRWGERALAWRRRAVCARCAELRCGGRG